MLSHTAKSLLTINFPLSTFPKQHPAPLTRHRFYENEKIVGKKATSNKPNSEVKRVLKIKTPYLCSFYLLFFKKKSGKSGLRHFGQISGLFYSGLLCELNDEFRKEISAYPSENTLKIKV